jgi:hypothetical protein
MGMTALNWVGLTVGCVEARRHEMGGRIGLKSWRNRRWLGASGGNRGGRCQAVNCVRENCGQERSAYTEECCDEKIAEVLAMAVVCFDFLLFLPSSVVLFDLHFGVLLWTEPLLPGCEFVAVAVPRDGS